MPPYAHTVVLTECCEIWSSPPVGGNRGQRRELGQHVCPPQIGGDSRCLPARIALVEEMREAATRAKLIGYDLGTAQLPTGKLGGSHRGDPGRRRWPRRIQQDLLL